MKSGVIAFLALVLTGGLLAAASHQSAPAAQPSVSKSPMPVIAIQEVETDSPETYALLVSESNKIIKEKFGLDNYTRVFVGQAAGEDSGKTFAVSTTESFAKLTENGKAFEEDLALAKLRPGMDQVRTLGHRIVLKAVRFEGRNDTSVVYNTRVVVSDEAGYLRALDGFRQLLDSHGLTDVKINCYRAVAGRKDYTHLVSLNCASPERRAALLDAISEPWVQQWIADSAKFRTVVSNGNYREITK